MEAKPPGPVDIMATYQFKCDLVEMSVKDFYLHFKQCLPKLIMITQGYCGEVVLDTFDREQVLRIHTYSIQKRVIAKMCDGCRLPGVDGTHLSIPINYDAKFCVIKGDKVRKEETLQDIVNKCNFPVDVQFGKSGGTTIKVGDTDKSTRQTGGQAFRISLLDTHEEFFLLGNAVAGTSLYGKVTVVPVYLPDLRLSVINGFACQPQERFDAVCRQMHNQVMKNIRFENIHGNEDIAVYSGHATSQDIYSYASPVEYCHIDDGMEKGRKKSKRDVYTELVPSSPYDNVYDIIPHDSKLDDSVYHEPDPRHMISGTTIKAPPAPKPKPITTPKPPAQNPVVTPKPPAQNPVVTPKPQPQIPATAPKPPRPLPPEEPFIPTDDKEEESNKKPPPPVPERQYYLRRKMSESRDPEGQNPTSANRDTEQFLPEENPTRSVLKNTSANDSSSQVNVDELSVDELCQWMVRLKLEKYTEKFKDQLIDGAILRELDSDLLTGEIGMTRIEAIRLLKFATESHVPKIRNT